MPALIDLSGLDACVRLCGQLGLSFIELNLNMPEFQPDTLDARRLRRISAREGVRFTLHLDEN
jgi:sugar phosphate isomerase/epimerase